MYDEINDDVIDAHGLRYGWPFGVVRDMAYTTGTMSELDRMMRLAMFDYLHDHSSVQVITMEISPMSPFNAP